jgi:hypothetical protein
MCLTRKPTENWFEEGVRAVKQSSKDEADNEQGKHQGFRFRHGCELQLVTAQHARSEVVYEVVSRSQWLRDVCEDCDT